MENNERVHCLHRNPFLEAANKLRTDRKAARSSLKWSIVFGAIFAIFTYDIIQYRECHSLTMWYMIEWAVAVICGLNFLAHFACCLRFSFQKKMRGTERQRQLLGFEPNDPLFEVVEPANESVKSDRDEKRFAEAFTLTRLSCLSQPTFSTPRRHGSRSQLDESSPNVTYSSGYCFDSPYKQYSHDKLITDEKSLQNYLKRFEEQQNSSEYDSYERSNSGHVRSFGSFTDTAAYLLKTSAYQLSPLISETSPNKDHSRDSTRLNFAYINSDILSKTTPEQLAEYVVGLRKWIAITILHRLVKEINTINDSFKNRGIIEMEIGSIGLERLRKTVENQQFVSQYMPMLPLILPFLEISSNQEYLLQRIKDLANGYCIADYRWNSGSSYHGLKWDEHLPTDSSIIFHLLCVYLDTQLMPLPQGGGRPFFNRYVVMNDEKRSMKDVLDAIQNRAHCAILCTNPLQPKFNFITDKKVHNCIYDRNNLFHVIIQFLIYMKEQQDGLLEGVNLGRSGINILCVIGE